MLRGNANCQSWSYGGERAPNARVAEWLSILHPYLSCHSLYLRIVELCDDCCSRPSAVSPLFIGSGLRLENPPTFLCFCFCLLYTHTGQRNGTAGVMGVERGYASILRLLVPMDIPQRHELLLSLVVFHYCITRLNGDLLLSIRFVNFLLFLSFCLQFYKSESLNESVLLYHKRRNMKNGATNNGQ